MKYIAMTVLTLLAMAAFSLGMFELFDAPIDLQEKPPKSKIEFLEKINFYSCDEAHGDEITKLFKGPQHCEQHADCQYKEQYSGCGTYAINKTNAAKIKALMNDPTCFRDMILECSHGFNPQHKPLCIEQQCQSALAVDTEEEMKRFLQSYRNELHQLFFNSTGVIKKERLFW